MFKRLILVLCTIVFIVAAESADSLINEAVALYETRHLNIDNVFKSRAMLEGLVENQATNERCLYELAKVYYLLGDMAQNKEEKLTLYGKGKEYGKKAIQVNDNSSWAHFWYMVNLGRIGQTKGVLNSLALVPEIKKEIDRVLQIDPRHTGALDARAMLYYELPWLLGGNLKKSIDALNKAIAIDSNYTVLYVDMTKVYMKKKDYERAHWFAEKVLKIESPTYEADYILKDKPAAESLLQELESN